jgi:hypothetical protein
MIVVRRTFFCKVGQASSTSPTEWAEVFDQMSLMQQNRAFRIQELGASAELITHVLTIVHSLSPGDL